MSKVKPNYEQPTVEKLQARVDGLEDDNKGYLDSILEINDISFQQATQIAELKDKIYALEQTDVTMECLVAERARTKSQQVEIAELEGLIVAAQCPCCNGDGAYYDGNGEVCQCQWCYETEDIKKRYFEQLRSKANG